MHHGGGKAGRYQVIARILVITALSELVVMGILGALGAPRAGRWALVDAGLLVVVSAPFLYAGVVRPVAHRLQERAELARALLERELTEALRESEAKFAHVFDAVSDLIFMIEVEEGGGFRCLAVNRAYYEVTGMTREQVLGKRVEEVLPPQAAAYVIGKYREAIRLGRSIRYEEEVDMPAGRVTVETTLIPIFDKGGRCTHLMGIARDVTERRRLEARLRYLADHDPLTGLPNRRHLERELARRMDAAARGRGGAVLFLDLDRFACVNDGLGHRAGDQVLKTVAGLLREAVGGTALLARLGGDEFAVLVPEADAARARAVAERLLDALRSRDLEVAGQSVRLTASVGIALFPQHGGTADEVISWARWAMGRAKERGRNHVSVYAPDEDTPARSQLRITWVKRIREALDQDRFLLYLQPMLDLRRDRVTQHEVLLRLVGPEGEVIPPSAFLGVADQFGLIRDIDRWVVRQAIRLVAEQRRAGTSLRLAINLSGKALSDPLFPALVREELAATVVDPASLVFEITEMTAVAGMDDARRCVEVLKSVGCRFGLDDFGVGFSSFEYLKHLPVDYLKIDGSSVRQLPHSPVDQHLVRAMVEVARGLGMETVAEFVGDAETVRLLKALGVDYAQGYYVGEPRPARAAVAG